MSPEAIRNLDALNVTMNGGSTLLNIVLAFVMFGVALGIKPATFVDIIKNPKSILTGITCQLILLPALTLILIMICGDWISPMIALGMILVASCPGGNISNFITSLSRGNSELSVSLTAFNTAACIFTTPLNFAFWGKMYLNFAGNRNIGVLPELQIPLGDIFQSIFIIMGIPLILGILCGQYLPKVAKVLKKPLQHLSIIVFIAMVIIIFKGNFDVFMQAIRYIFLIVLIHNLLALGIGFGTSTLMKLPYKDRRTITIETGIQNSGLGLILLLNPNIFPEVGAWANNGGMLVITAWWGVWHIISGLTLAFVWRLRGRKEAGEE
ncbi:MAG: bile acid:sodium symporter family protein [Bacteroidales bacterium]|nr:bile acid:sodium symporter family protein [Bacteroidales bacterium]MBQ8809995.1 bile acid:sodium symporter family protein [Bacteroidales bacterium]